MQVLTRMTMSAFPASLVIAGIFWTCSCCLGDQGILSNQHTQGGAHTDCIYFGNPERTSARHKFEIQKPGHYCLTEDLHARVELADHPAEDTMIDISSADVVLDLQGHTLGRGRFFKNPGGMGIRIADPGQTIPSKNIIVRNGVLQDFNMGIGFHAHRWPSTLLDTPAFDPKTNTYHFPANNITLENITFRNNKKNFEILVPPEPQK